LGHPTPEQFASVRQGPWTDIYGTGTPHHAVTGQAPPGALLPIALAVSPTGDINGTITIPNAMAPMPDRCRASSPGGGQGLRQVRSRRLQSR